MVFPDIGDTVRWVRGDHDLTGRVETLVINPPNGDQPCFIAIALNGDRLWGNVIDIYSIDVAV